MIGKDLSKAQKLLVSGQVIAIPTETVYGLAAHAFCYEAIQKIYFIKKRPYNKPLPIQVHSIDKVKDLVRSFPWQARQLAQAFWPGPLTLILKKENCIPDLVTAGKATVAIRIPNHPITLQLLKNLPFPLVVTSANLSGYPSPVTVQQVDQQLGYKIPYILDGGDCRVGIESTIIGFDQGRPRLYRPGYIGERVLKEL